MTQYKLAGIGNAVVDVISHADDNFLEMMGIEKGIMQLIEQDRGETLYAAMSERVQTPGGAVANTIAGAGALGLERWLSRLAINTARGCHRAGGDCRRGSGTDEFAAAGKLIQPGGQR